MSYDIDLVIDAGGPEPVQITDGLNYTSNCAGMWRKAMPETDGLADMDGLDASAAAVRLRAGIAKMEQDPDAYRALNPANGWGDYESQLEMLRELLSQCEAAPRATVRVSR
ncbi:MAG: hypothetical protein ITG02_02415 [Patulibacter sp.]|nr:hypothetical protein [Patulibacter sp.]